jgi:TetR/AcrR family transcriptional regulator
MDDSFFNIDEEKRDRIINAALEEFSKNSFTKASTNTIVHNAGISKGILFHYFTSKKKLYDYLVDFAFSKIIRAIENEVDWNQSDFFYRIKEVGIIKSKAMAKYPYLAGFTKVMYDTTSLEAMKELALKYNPHIYHDIYFKNIDYSKFKDTVNIEKAINITQWTFEKLGEQWFNQHKNSDTFDFDKLSKEVDVYLEMLKQTFYKE